MPIILVVEVGKFEVPERVMAKLRSFAEQTYGLLKEENKNKLAEEYSALFTFLTEGGTRISLVDPRPVDLILPSPSADYELLHRIFIG